MPKLWNDTIEAHRRAVHDAILDAAAALVGEGGPASVTMSRIAQRSGIGRATLYKYFRDVEAVVFAWHERQVATHLEHLTRVRDRACDAAERLRAVLESHGLASRRDHGGELVALLHRGEHVARAHQRLHDFVRDLLAEGAREGRFRDDVEPDELARYCLHALGAAGESPSEGAIGRLVEVVMSGLRPAPVSS